MPEDQFLAAVGAALEMQGWSETDLGGAWQVTTQNEGLPMMFLRLAVPTSALAILETSVPLVRNPTDATYVSQLAMNGGLAGDGAQFSNYVADAGGTYLGAFVKQPVPSGLWYPPPVADLLWMAARGVATLRARFEAFAVGQAEALGDELMPLAPTACPEKLSAVIL